VKNWDRDEKLGDVFVASFSKTVVLDAYSDFINNFSIAMDLAKQESKRKSALADFLKVKQISSHDRLSFFGLMVKPVQRFPQFILFLQVKHILTFHLSTQY
jgi:Rho guanine nucleotide exchange factor 10